MGKVAFVFAGQGAQYVGMGKDIMDRYEKAGKIFDEASEVLGFDIKEMILNGNDEDLKITENTQPAILSTSMVCLVPLLENGIKADVVAGLSLGEYTAHVASGSISFSDAVKLVRKRGKYMQEAVPLGVGTMAAIIGLADEAVVELCLKASVEGIIEPANFNCPGQVVVAGEVKAIEKMLEIAKENGAKRAMILPVSAPFHCSMLKPAGERLAEELGKVEFLKMNTPVVTNVTADYIKDESQIKDLLIRQVSSPVMWEKSVKRMVEDGVDTFVEIGPGKILSGFVKKIDRKLKILNVENIDSLEKTLSSL